jgi:3-dehydroquinate synthase
MWAAFVEARLERSSTVVALGGGVVGDMTGFAAATFLRGINWVNVPTTLLAMVDSSLGGKTGIDLAQGKNLVGAFYPPRLVLADPTLLRSLPDSELRSGLAETIKHGVIDDPALFARCGQGWPALTANLDAVARQGMAVKVKVIEVDPYERGIRQALNLGHTVGHGVELASAFRLSHGEAVAIGMVVEARLAEACGVAEAGLAEELAVMLQSVGLPVSIPPELDRERIVAAMQMDKKRAAGKQRFALPERIGAVRVGVEVEDWQTLIFR